MTQTHLLSVGFRGCEPSRTARAPSEGGCLLLFIYLCRILHPRTEIRTLAGGQLRELKIAIAGRTDFPRACARRQRRRSLGKSTKSEIWISSHRREIRRNWSRKLYEIRPVTFLDVFYFISRLTYYYTKRLEIVFSLIVPQQGTKILE